MQEEKENSQLRYVRWLLNRIGGITKPIIFLCKCLLNIEFYYLIDDDSNRSGDAEDIRNDYIKEVGLSETSGLLVMPSVLEVLVGLSERATIMDFDKAVKWFELFIDNLGLGSLTDDKWSYDAEMYVRSTVRSWLDRRFSANGIGSPFRGNGTYDVSKTSMWNSLQWYLSNSYGGDAI